MHEEWINPILRAARAQGLERQTRVYPACGGKIRINSREILNFSSNDYLDLARHPHVIERSRQALGEYGAGSTASRLVTGTLPIHEELENRIAKKKGCPAALVFGSGYLANAGTIPVLAGRDDVIFADKLVHASMIDACKLSGAKLIRFAHNDPDALKKRLLPFSKTNVRKLILTESVFSMDGDLAPLSAIATLAKEHGAMLMVDEAHAFGVFGPHGAGRVRELGMEKQINVSMGTMSKAFGGYGGFIACSENLRKLLVHSARAFIFTTAPPPAVIGAALGTLDVLETDPDLGPRLLKNADHLRQLLNRGGLNTLRSESQIIPVLIGKNEKAVAISHRLREQSVLAAAIRPPTVPAGTARLRLAVSLAHTIEDLEFAAKAVIQTARAEI